MADIPANGAGSGPRPGCQVALLVAVILGLAAAVFVLGRGCGRDDEARWRREREAAEARRTRARGEREGVMLDASIVPFVVAGTVVLFVIVFAIKGLKIISQAQTMVIERLGKYHRTLSSGVNII
jgi:hypothetical protein